jgi:hypothetical protein
VKTDHSTPKRRLAVESLESRTALAGNVTASVVDGTLILEGDDQANELIVRQVAQSYSGAWPGAKLQISSNSTTINGQNSVTLGGIKNVTVHLGAGDDEFRVLGGVRHQLQALPGAVQIDGGAGKDRILLYYAVNHRQVTISGGTGTDFVETGGGVYYGLTIHTDSLAADTPEEQINLLGILAKGPMSLTGGAGNDGFRIVGASVLDGPLNVSMGSGQNNLGFGSSSGHAEWVPTVNRPVSVTGGSARDYMSLSAGQFNATVTANLGDGADTFHVSPYADLKVSLGPGDDSAQLDSGIHSGTLDGGTGRDFIGRDLLIGPVIVSSFEFSAQLTRPLPVYRNPI